MGSITENILFAPFDVSAGGTISGGSWREGFGPECMQRDELDDFSRTTDVQPASTQWLVDLGREEVVQLVGFVDHNCTTAAQFRVTGWHDAAMTDPLDGADTGLQDVFPAYASTKALRPEDSNWLTGKPTERMLERFPRICFAIMDRPKFCRYLHYHVFDPYNPDGHLDVSRAWASSIFQPEVDIVRTAGFNWSDTQSERTRSPGGTVFVREQPLFRTATFTLGHLQTYEAYSQVMEMQRRVGTTRPFVLCMAPKQLQYLHLNTFYALFSQLMPLGYTDTLRMKADFEVEEQL